MRGGGLGERRCWCGVVGFFLERVWMSCRGCRRNGKVSESAELGMICSTGFDGLAILFYHSRKWNRVCSKEAVSWVSGVLKWFTTSMEKKRLTHIFAIPFPRHEFLSALYAFMSPENWLDDRRRILWLKVL